VSPAPARTLVLAAVLAGLVPSLPARAGDDVPRPAYVRCYVLTASVGDESPTVTVCSPV
jgi:hypothetical protein